jgi:hypothetical protein
MTSIQYENALLKYKNALETKSNAKMLFISTGDILKEPVKPITDGNIVNAYFSGGQLLIEFDGRIDFDNDDHNLMATMGKKMSDDGLQINQ